MAELYRYAAFISYSSKDAKFAQRLHRALESYTIPKALGTFDLIGGGKKNRIYPVFRDREELSPGHLGERIEAALKASNALVVVCSPNGAASPWVQKEIHYFVSLGRRDRIFAIIAEDAPLADKSGADCTETCFPPAFRSDALEDAAALEPLAADARKEKDGFRNAWLKLVAGLVGVSPGQLLDRDKRLRMQRTVRNVSVSLVSVALLGFAAAYADGRAWRAAIIADARMIAASGRVLDAATLGLAASTRRGSLVPISLPEAVETFPEQFDLVADLGLASANLDTSGDYVYGSTANQRGYVLNLRTGVKKDLGFTRELEFSGSAGIALFSRLSDDRYYLWDIETDRVRELGLRGVGAALSPDGTRIAVAARGEVFLFDVRSGTRRTIGVAPATNARVHFSNDGRRILAISDYLSEAVYFDLDSGVRRV
ncbi:MAG TPA: TIR domain-containing protein, partial [Candidatus Binatia bacterium]|nr:TIR domain-containing protein [Candidatus Binatia bacterium]